MTLKLRPRLHWHNSFTCWCDPPELTEQDRLLLTTGLAGFCEHGVGMLDDCPQCCPPEPERCGHPDCDCIGGPACLRQV